MIRMDRAGTVAALGEGARIEGFALAGVLLRPAEDPAAVRSTWRELPREVAVVILTKAAALALGPAVVESTSYPIAVVMPS